MAPTTTQSRESQKKLKPKPKTEKLAARVGDAKQPIGVIVFEQSKSERVNFS